MREDRVRYGLLVAALGAILLAVSVYLPWYGVTITPAGIAAAQRAGAQAASEFGNAALQNLFGSVQAQLGSLAGHELAALSAHQVLKVLRVLLLVLAALALLDALVPLVRTERLPAGAGASLALVGFVAGACVLYRIFVPPVSTDGMVTLAPREGAWLALAGSAMIVAGGLWPRARRSKPVSETSVESVWSGLSGWTPQA